MRVMFLSFVAIALISTGAWFGLENAGFSSAEEYSSPSVRLD